MIGLRVSGRIANTHHSDLDPCFHCNAYPDPFFFSVMRIRILIKVMGIVVLWYTDPTGFQVEPPCLHFERPQPSTDLFWAFKALEFFTLMRIWIRIQLFTLMRIGIWIKLPKIKRIYLDPQPWFLSFLEKAKRITSGQNYVETSKLVLKVVLPGILFKAF